MELISRNRYVFNKNHYSDYKALFKKKFFESELNTWILRPPNLKRSIEILFDSINEDVISYFLDKELGMVSCQGLWAATLPPQKNLFLIIIFPNLLDLFNSSNYRLGIAVLAHEIGHIFREHSKRNLTLMEEQFEADFFAGRLGFTKELINFLSMYPDSNECKIRKERLIKEVKERHLTF